MIFFYYFRIKIFMISKTKKCRTKKEEKFLNIIFPLSNKQFVVVVYIFLLCCASSVASLYSFPFVIFQQFSSLLKKNYNRFVVFPFQKDVVGFSHTSINTYILLSEMWWCDYIYMLRISLSLYTSFSISVLFIFLFFLLFLLFLPFFFVLFYAMNNDEGKNHWIILWTADA